METPAAKKQRMEINGGENGFGLDVGINYSESSVSLNVWRCSSPVCDDLSVLVCKTSICTEGERGEREGRGG